MLPRHWIGLISVVVLITACSSTPKTDIHYFVLNPSINNSTNTSSSTNSNLDLEHETNRSTAINTIELKPIQLAKFLDQPGIVLQTDQHEIKVAHYHRWAEPLKKNLHRYIAQSLGINHTSEHLQTLEIQFQQFQGTQEGGALISGHWKINQVSQPFSYQAPLTKTGYTELVTQLAFLLDQLCADILNQLNVPT